MPVHKIFREETTSSYAKGYDQITKTLAYCNAKTSQAAKYGWPMIGQTSLADFILIRSMLAATLAKDRFVSLTTHWPNSWRRSHADGYPIYCRLF